MLNLSKNRRLDEWYLSINRIYLDRNFYRDEFSVFAHLVEVVGGLSLLASNKRKHQITPEKFIPKAIAWWMTLCGKMGVRSVEDMLWQKFPGVCTYCHKKPHRYDECIEIKKYDPSPNWKKLNELSKVNLKSKPSSLGEWLNMFAEIYPVVGLEEFPATFARFSEELGELAEALRVFPIAPGYFLSEASDVFAWLMHLQLLVYDKQSINAKDRGDLFAQTFLVAYRDCCSACGNSVCTCPPILQGTKGRIAHDLPLEIASFSDAGAILSTAEAFELFELGSRSIVIGDSKIEVTLELIKDINITVGKLAEYVAQTKEISEHIDFNTLQTFQEIRNLTSKQRITQSSIEDLTRIISALPSESRNVALGFLTNISAGPWVTALIEAVKLAVT